MGRDGMVWYGKRYCIIACVAPNAQHIGTPRDIKKKYRHTPTKGGGTSALSNHFGDDDDEDDDGIGDVMVWWFKVGTSRQAADEQSKGRDGFQAC